MILCALADFPRHAALHARFPELARHLVQLDLSALPEGRTELNGEALFVIGAPRSRTRPEAPLEAHDRYIDIQVVLAGVDTMGWAPRSVCGTIREPYDRARDIVFFGDPILTRIPVPAGCLAVFFPEDAHAPLLGDGEPVAKVVFKVRVD